MGEENLGLRRDEARQTKRCDTRNEDEEEKKKTTNQLGEKFALCRSRDEWP